MFCQVESDAKYELLCVCTHDDDDDDDGWGMMDDDDDDGDDDDGDDDDGDGDDDDDDCDCDCDDLLRMICRFLPSKVWCQAALAWRPYVWDLRKCLLKTSCVSYL